MSCALDKVFHIADASPVYPILEYGVVFVLRCPCSYLTFYNAVSGEDMLGEMI